MLHALVQRGNGLVDGALLGRRRGFVGGLGAGVDWNFYLVLGNGVIFAGALYDPCVNAFSGNKIFIWDLNAIRSANHRLAFSAQRI